MGLRVCDEGEGGILLADILPHRRCRRFEDGHNLKPGALIVRIAFNQAVDTQITQRAGGIAKEREQQWFASICGEPDWIAKKVKGLKERGGHSWLDVHSIVLHFTFSILTWYDGRNQRSDI